MSFDSAFFLLFFFPVLFILYFAVKNLKARNVIILAAGLVFYSFGRLFDLLVLLFMAGLTYLAGVLIRRDKRPKAALWAAVLFDLLVLAAFKTAERAIVTVIGPDAAMRLLFSGASPVTISAPLGVSFFAFKCVAYTVDVYRDRENTADNFFRFLLYVSFLPEIVSGPISRYHDFAAQLDGREVSFPRAAEGLTRLIRGLGKKLLLAGAAGKIADAVFGFGGGADIRLAWAGAAAYSIQLFFDFSGYSDMAIGLAGVFGFTSPENFNYPYTAVSITDFWRRWHMSLSGWFKDYLYIPLGGNRKGKYRTAVNKFIVFALCGLWHGFGLTFILWGVWHGVLAALESLKLLNVPKWREHRAGAVLSRVYTLLAVTVGFVMFRAADAGQGFRMIGAMFAGFRFTREGTALLAQLMSARSILMLALGIAFSMPCAGAFAARVSGKWTPVLRYVLYAGLFALCAAELAAGGFSPFIYAQF